MSELTAKRLRELVHYDPSTGVFRRRVSRGNSRAGSVLGCDDERGYLKIWIDGRGYRCGRLAFLYMLGRWPRAHVDHINHVHDDDRWNNLREASNRDNNQNVPMRSDNRSGCTGVYWCKYKQKWCAKIMANGKSRHLGYYDDINEAALVRKEALKEHGFHENHGRAA